MVLTGGNAMVGNLQGASPGFVAPPLLNGGMKRGKPQNALWVQAFNAQTKIGQMISKGSTAQQIEIEINKMFGGLVRHNPITPAAVDTLKAQLKPELMKGALCPAMVKLLKTVNPVMHGQISRMSKQPNYDLKNHFNAPKWINQTEEGASPPLTEIADFYFTDDSNKTIRQQLDSITPAEVKKTENKVIVTLTLGEEEKYTAAQEFLEQVLNEAVEFIYVPRDLKTIKKEISDKIGALIKDGHGVNMAMINQKIDAIQFEMDVIKAANPAGFENTESKKNFKSTTQGYRYQVLQDRLNGLRELKENIEGNTQKLKDAVNTPRKLFELLKISIDNPQDGLEDEAWALLLHQNMEKINEQLESYLANQYDEVWGNIATELAGSVSITADSIEDQINTKLKKDKVADSFQARFQGWGLDVSLIGVQDEYRVPETAFLLWGRHAGVDKQTIMNLWGKLKEKTPENLVRSLTVYCTKRPKITAEMTRELNGLTDQLAKIKSPAADIPHIKTKGVKNNLDQENNIRGFGKKFAIGKISKKVRDVIINRSNRTDLLEKQFTLKPTMTLQECFAPFVRPGHDGQPEVKEILFKGPKKELENLNSTMKAAIEKLMRGETIEGELKSLNEAFNMACKSSTISSGVKKIEEMKIRYLEQLNAMVEANDTQRANSIQSTAAATITLESGAEIRGVALKRQNEGTGLDLPGDEAKFSDIIKGLLHLPENNAEQTQAILYGRAMARLSKSPDPEQLVSLCNAVMKNHNPPGQTLPLPVTFHQDLRDCLKRMNNEQIKTFLGTPSESDQVDISGGIGFWRSTLVMALFHPPGAMDSLFGATPAIQKNQYKSLCYKVFEAYQAKPELLMAHLDGNRGSPEQENSFRKSWVSTFETMFPQGREWSYDEQQTLLAATMTWPPAIREALQGLEGVFSGAKGHVMDTVCKDPGVVLHRYQVRCNKLKADGSVPVDDAWLQMLHLNNQINKQNNAPEVAGSLTYEKAKEFLEDSVDPVLKSITVTKGPSAGDGVASPSDGDVKEGAEATQQDQEQTIEGRLAELAVICRALPDLSDDKRSAVLKVLTHRQLYYAKSDDRSPIQTIQAAVVSHLLSNDDLLNDKDNVQKCMIMMNRLKDTGYSNDIAESIATLGGETWATKVKAALSDEDTSTTEDTHSASTLIQQLQTAVFSSLNGEINLEEEGSGFTEIKFNATTNAFNCKGPNEQSITLNPVKMVATKDEFISPRLTKKAVSKLKKLYFTNGKKIPPTFECSIAGTHSDNAIRLGKDGPFMVTEADGNVTVYYNKASKDGADAWLTNVDPLNKVNIQADRGTVAREPFAAYVKSLGGHFWSDHTGQTYVYDTDMVCLFKIDGHGKITRTSDGATLTFIDSTPPKFKLVWELVEENEGQVEENEGQQVMEIIQGHGKITLQKSNGSFINSAGFIYQNTEGAAMVFKHPTEPEYQVIEFDSFGAGIPITRTTRHPNNDSPMAVRLKQSENASGLIADDVIQHAVGADALSQVLQAMACLKEDSIDAEQYSQQWLALLGGPPQRATVPLESLQALIAKIRGKLEDHPQKLALSLTMLAMQLPLIDCEVGGAICPVTQKLLGISSEDLNVNYENIPGSNNEQQNTLLVAHLLAAVATHQTPEIDKILIEIKKNFKGVNLNLSPVARRALAQALVGMHDEGAGIVNELKKALSIDTSIEAKQTYAAVHARAIQKTDADNPALVVLKDENDRTQFDLNNVKGCKKHLHAMEERLALALRRMNAQHLTAQDVVNMVIQGDPYGILGTSVADKTALQRLAMGVLILRTEATHLRDADVVGYTHRAYAGMLEQVLTGNVESPDKALEAMRKCAVYLVCEDQLGHRMREEQFKAVEGILSGTTKLAELRTGFGKTDVVLFVVALYKGFGKGVRMTAPDGLLPINVKDINRKLGGLMSTVWQPNLDFNTIKESASTEALQQFLAELKAHNQRGDIMFASHYSFDEQLDDCLNVCIHNKKITHVKALFEIKKELNKMALNIDEVHAFDPNHKFNIMEGKEEFKTFERVELARKVITKVHETFSKIKGVNIKIDQSVAYNGFIDSEEKTRAIFEAALDQGFQLPEGSPKTWDTSNLSEQAKFVHHLLFTLGPQVYGKQYNLHYGLRPGTLEAVPYVANNQPSSGENFTDAELIQWLTFNARVNKGVLEEKIDVSANMLMRLYKASTQLADIDSEKFENIRTLLGWVVKFCNKFEKTEAKVAACHALAQATADTNPDRQQLDALLDELKSTDKQALSFYLFGNTAVKTTLYESNPAQALMSDCIAGNVFGCSGTLNQSGIPIAVTAGKEEAVSKTGIQLEGEPYKNEEFYDHVFGVGVKINTLKDKFTNKDKNVRRVSNTDATIKEFIKMARAEAGTQLFVDAGALIQGKSNRAVAEQLAEGTKVEGRANKWVVYYDTKREALHAIQKSGNGFKELTYTELVEKCNSGEVKKQNIIGFLDEERKTGADLKKITQNKPKMCITISKNNTQSGVIQAIGRDRTQTYNFDVIVRETEFDRQNSISEIYKAVKTTTKAKNNQMLFSQILMDAKAALVEDVRQVLQDPSTDMAALLQNDEFLRRYDSLVSTTMATDLSEFSVSKKPLKTIEQLKEYLEDQKTKLLKKAKALQRIIDESGSSKTLTISPESDQRSTDITPNTIFHASFRREQEFDQDALSQTPIQVADASSTAQATNQAEAETQGMAEVESQSQQQSIVSAMELAAVLRMDASDNSNRLNAPQTLTSVNLKETQVSKAPTFEKSEFDALFKLHPTLAVNLRQLNLIEHIRFSNQWLADLQQGEPPRLHTMVKKNDVIYVITPEELAFIKRSDSGSEVLTDATPIYHDIMGKTKDEILDITNPRAKAQTIALQSLVDNLETDDLNAIFKQESEEALLDINKSLIGQASITQTRDQFIQLLGKKRQGAVGIPYLVATQLLRQLQQQSTGSDIKVLQKSDNGCVWANAAPHNGNPPLLITGIMLDPVEIQTAVSDMAKKIKEHLFKAPSSGVTERVEEKFNGGVTTLNTKLSDAINAAKNTATAQIESEHLQLKQAVDTATAEFQTATKAVEDAKSVVTKISSEVDELNAQITTKNNERADAIQQEAELKEQWAIKINELRNAYTKEKKRQKEICERIARESRESAQEINKYRIKKPTPTIDEGNFNARQEGLERAIKTFEEKVKTLQIKARDDVSVTEVSIHDLRNQISQLENNINKLTTEDSISKKKEQGLLSEIGDLKETLKNNNDKLEKLNGNANHLRKLLEYQQCYKELNAANEQCSSALERNRGAQDILAKLDQIDKRQNGLLSSLNLTMEGLENCDITIDQIELIVHVLHGFQDKNPWPNTVIEYSREPIGHARIAGQSQRIEIHKSITLGSINNYGGIKDRLASSGSSATFGALMFKFDGNKFKVLKKETYDTISFKFGTTRASALQLKSKPLLVAILKKAKQKFFSVDQSFDYEKLADSFLNTQSALRKALKNAYNVELSNLTTHLPDRDNGRVSKDSLLRQLNRSPEIIKTRDNVKKLQQQYNNICKSLRVDPNSPPAIDDSTDYVSQLEKINDQMTEIKNEIAEKESDLEGKENNLREITKLNVARGVAIGKAKDSIKTKSKSLVNKRSKLNRLQQLQRSLTIDPFNFSRIDPPQSTMASIGVIEAAITKLNDQLREKKNEQTLKEGELNKKQQALENKQEKLQKAQSELAMFIERIPVTLRQAIQEAFENFQREYTSEKLGGADTFKGIQDGSVQNTTEKISIAGIVAEVEIPSIKLEFQDDKLRRLKQFLQLTKEDVSAMIDGANGHRVQLSDQMALWEFIESVQKKFKTIDDISLLCCSSSADRFMRPDGQFKLPEGWLTDDFVLEMLKDDINSTITSNNQTIVQSVDTMIAPHQPIANSELSNLPVVTLHQPLPAMAS